ncbi:bifunctional 4-hydroxy-2-oxoglutarate aldolase/2-dehydro-3-deoxy-phosphogluconate aldolase [Rathayibacter soli]|uniref:bifunctional 4-hydroxy-2-oxoglutarate aldolase/2-dehydro-3-deoxy-phosphogluconate aldolase n=1 Tax=Rathayibacter soli TaxID=3144168 RepID=UPI0027E4EB49|nr:bifunctional 4-hydroxy-2-oxoglutarate aldolase/2-dehydro-3-deoxy-phosphogluconate aldolase [Glaciibacter superstes]
MIGNQPERTDPDPIAIIGEDRAVALVRAREIPDAAALCSALTAGGIRAVEFTFTTPNVLAYIADAVRSGAVVGAGTVLTIGQAHDALAAGASFLVTPGLSPAVARIGVEQGVPVLMGAFTPSEVMQALDLGAAAIKVFPAETAGPTYFKHLLGPLPGVRLIGSGGINEGNAAEFIAAGAYAVTAGSSVIDAAALAASDWAAIEASARRFVDCLAG